MGVGFGKQFPTLLNNKHKFIRGNHDNPEMCSQISECFNSFGYETFGGISFFYIAGADSIDKNTRTPEVDWWEDEQLSEENLDKAIKLYAEIKPELVLSHECPRNIAKFIIKNAKPNRTNVALEKMFALHKPKTWIFGHYHKTSLIHRGRTTFMCLDMLQTITLLNNYM